MPLQTGQILQGRYRIVRQIGLGGMGAVYLAEDVRLRGRQCAVKEQLADPNATPQLLAQLRRQFEEEASILSRLDHPNLPKVSDYFAHDGNEYLVMDYVAGETLEAALARHGKPLPERPVLIWAEQILDALHYLHTRQPHPIIHRDIKPANIILTQEGRIKLVDFGLVKLIDLSNPRTATIVQGMGTPQYAPLEQFAGPRHTDARSDIYSFGATLYHLLTNQEPLDVHQRMLQPDLFATPQQLIPSLSDQTNQTILTAIGIYPNQRFQSAKEFSRSLGRNAPKEVFTIPSSSKQVASRQRAKNIRQARSTTLSKNQPATATRKLASPFANTIPQNQRKKATHFDSNYTPSKMLLWSVILFTISIGVTVLGVSIFNNLSTAANTQDTITLQQPTSTHTPILTLIPTSTHTPILTLIPKISGIPSIERNNFYSRPFDMTIDTNGDYEAIFKTEKGEMRFQLYADITPVTVNNFVNLAQAGFYDNTTFHRVLADFMAQGGDPTGSGTGGPGYHFEDEVDNDLVFDRRGLLAMANSGPATNGSQFFITFGPTPHLNGAHTIFGELIDGDDVLSSIDLRNPNSATTLGDVIETIEIRWSGR